MEFTARPSNLKRGNRDRRALSSEADVIAGEGESGLAPLHLHVVRRHDADLVHRYLAAQPCFNHRGCWISAASGGRVRLPLYRGRVGTRASEQRPRATSAPVTVTTFV